jgi:nicotinamidase-related amidase
MSNPIDGNKGRRTCVILLDFQNEFAKPGGKLHDTVVDSINQNGMLEKVPLLIKVAREKGALIIHAPVIMKTGVRFMDNDFDPHAYASMDGLFVEGTWNSQFIDEIQPLTGEEILHGRNDFCAFQGTELLSILMRNKIDTVVMAGFLSNVCIEETASVALEKIPQLKVVVCSDGCAAKTKEDHDNAMTMSLPVHGCEIMTCFDAGELISMEQQPINKMSGQDSSQARPRILAMHGARSNDDITKLQLENLGITDDEYDIVYLTGGIEVEEGDPEIASLIRGPYYSWFEDKKGTDLRRSILSGVRDILERAEALGPFDGVYGFSSGAAMAALSACINVDPQLQAAIKLLDKEIATEERLGSTLLRSMSMAGRATSSRKTKSQSVLRGFLSKVASTKKVGSIETGDLVSPPFKFAILACTATPFAGVTELRRLAGLPMMSLPENNAFSIPSFHIIGIEDQFKIQSEEFASLFANRKVMYIPGGHGTY